MTTAPVKLDPERDLAVRRVMEVWAIWAPAYKIDAELTPLQRCAVLNLMFEVQRREQEYWKIELPPYDPEKI